MRLELLKRNENAMTMGFCTLPNDLLYPIFSQVRLPKCIYKWMQTDKRNYTFINGNEPLWAALFKNHFPNYEQMTSCADFSHQKLHQRFLTIENHLGQNKFHKFELKYGGLSRIRGVSSFANKFVWNSWEKTVVWDVESREQSKIIPMTDSGLDNVYAHRDKLFVSDDDVLNVYDLNNYEHLYEIEEDLRVILVHEDFFFCIPSQYNRQDYKDQRLIKIFDAKNGEFIYAINLDELSKIKHVVRDLIVVKNSVFICNFENEIGGKNFITIVNLVSRLQVKKIQFIDKALYTLRAIDDEIFCGCSDSHILVLDHNGNEIRTIKTEFCDDITQMFAFGRKLILCSESGKVGVFDRDEEKIIKIIRNSNFDGMYTMKMSNGKLFIMNDMKNSVEAYDFA